MSVKRNRRVRRSELDDSVEAILNLPDCNWRADDDVAARIRMANTQCLCMSPRIHVNDKDKVYRPVLGSIIMSAYCHSCPFRNEEIPLSAYRRMMRITFPNRDASRPPMRVMIVSLALELKATLIQWWSSHKSPVVKREVYLGRAAVCNVCESCQPPEKAHYCAECGCNVATAANLKSKKCPLGLWPGEWAWKIGQALLRRSKEETERKRREYADSFVAKPAPTAPGFWRRFFARLTGGH